MLSVKQGNYWFLLRLWYDAFLVGGLNPGPPALDASTLPLGYREGGILRVSWKFGTPHWNLLKAYMCIDISTYCFNTGLILVLQIVHSITLFIKFNLLERKFPIIIIFIFLIIKI